MYSAIQTLSGGEVLHSLSVGGGRTLLVLGGESEVQLLAWRGVYTPVQVGGDRNSITHTLVDYNIMFTDCMSRP